MVKSCWGTRAIRKTPYHPERDGSTRVPSKSRSAKGEDDYEQSEHSGREDAADKINPPDLLQTGQLFPRIVRGKDKNVDWRKDSSKWQIDVESLGRGLSAKTQTSMCMTAGSQGVFKRTHRQVALLTEKAPPMTGPRMAPVPQERPIRAL